MTVIVKCSCGCENTIQNAPLEVSDKITENSTMLVECTCGRKIVIQAYDYTKYAIFPMKVTDKQFKKLQKIFSRK